MKSVRILFIFLTVFFFCSLNVNAENLNSDTDNELTLNQVINMALAANHKIIISKIDVDAAMEAEKEAFAEFFPKLKTDYTYIHIGDQQWTAFDDPTGTAQAVDFGVKDSYLWTVSAVQNIFTGLAVVTGYQIGTLQKEMSDIMAADMELAVILEAKKAFFLVQNAKQLLEVEERSVTSLKDHLSVAMEYYNVGLTPKIDVLNAEVDLAQAYQFREKVKNRLVVAKAALNNIIDIPVDESIDTAGVLEFEKVSTNYTECVAKAVATRPGLKVAQKTIDITRKQVKLAKSKFYPNVAASVNYSRNGDDPDLNGTDYTNKDNWTVMAGASWTFWEWGKTKYAVAKAKKGVEKASRQLIKLEDEIRFQVKKAFHDLRTAENNINVAKKSVASADENLRISKERYKEQVAIITEVLDAETRLTRSETLLTTALNDYNVALATLNWAMGLK